MVMLDHLDVDSFEVISNKDLYNIVGGINISGSMLHSFIGAFNLVLDIGRSLGTALRRTFGRSICPIR